MLNGSIKANASRSQKCLKNHLYALFGFLTFVQVDVRQPRVVALLLAFRERWREKQCRLD